MVLGATYSERTIRVENEEKLSTGVLCLGGESNKVQMHNMLHCLLQKNLQVSLTRHAYFISDFIEKSCSSIPSAK